MSGIVIIESSDITIQVPQPGNAYIDSGLDSLVVNYQILKGDKGDPGDDAPITEHLQMFDHGELHEHTNKSLLDSLSFNNPYLELGGLPLRDVGALDLIVNLQSQIDALQARVYALEHLTP